MARAGIDFTLGSRRLFSVPRALSTWSFTLEDVLTARLPHPPLSGADGVRILSAPTASLPQVAAHYHGFIAGGRQDYHRHYIDMASGFDGYLARFSGKTRSTLKRKARKLSEAAGGYTVTAYRTPEEIATFLAAALPLSALTYQARLLGAGLPDDPAARRAMRELAQADRIRAFVLHADGKPVAYLALPVTGDTLVYAHLGYDPDWARLSVGTVLQMEALEVLFAEARFRWFDFTEGDGAHKALFGTHAATCSSLVLLKPTFPNRAVLGARAGFDAGVKGARTLAQRSGALERIRALLKT
ncbi:GNAT family N-acetyltransferase [Erythrobacter sp. R86502]|uniref:GNAT family N-acetyltransferase n=1 Tax=Erythrobacter sp. R86502 TaxID=3093846 RepID=UPI0036D325AE